MAFPSSVRHAALRRDQARCRHCGISQKEANLEVHHIVPEERGGNDTLGNAATLCIDCHYDAHGHIWTRKTPVSKTDISPVVVEATLNEGRLEFENDTADVDELKEKHTSEIEKLKANHASEIEGLESEITSLQDRLDGAKEHLEELEEKNTALQEDNIKKAQAITKLHSDIAYLNGWLEDRDPVRVIEIDHQVAERWHPRGGDHETGRPSELEPGGTLPTVYELPQPNRSADADVVFADQVDGSAPMLAPVADPTTVSVYREAHPSKVPDNILEEHFPERLKETGNIFQRIRYWLRLDSLG